MSEKASQRNLNMVQEIINEMYALYETDGTGRVGFNIPLSRKENRALKRAMKKQKKNLSCYICS